MTPLFTVPDGQMGVGLGIHGEPGIAEADLPAAADLARRLVDGVLAEAPGDTTRVGVILNGLGATKYEELFVVWRTVAPMLREAGYTLVDPEVGELVTSLDMAGCSLTLVFLDDELETLWRAPADTPAYRKGSRDDRDSGRRTAAHGRGRSGRRIRGDRGVPGGARRCGQTATAILAAIAVADRRRGRGTRPRSTRSPATATTGGAWSRAHRPPLAAATAADAAGAGAATVLTAAGEAWASQAGGTSGVLWGAALAALGERLGDDRDEITGADVAAAVRDGLDAHHRAGQGQARRQDHGRCAGTVRRPAGPARSRPAPRRRCAWQHAAADRRGGRTGHRRT